MCGITGYWNFKADQSVDSMRGTITAMTNTMYLRGPDSGGVWISPKTGLAFGHRRLAIRDLSPAGHQPMMMPCGRFVLTYNGEIYNAEELREELKQKGIVFSGTSDTEVILHGCANWGVEATVKRLIGMFAFSFWDGLTRKLTLVRDRLGIKPLYWGKSEGLFLFGSELKALCRHPGWKKNINRNAVAELMRCCYISGPLSIYAGISKLTPGCLLEISADGNVKNICYWDARKVTRDGMSQRFQGNDQELADELDLLLRDAVKRRMVADVPLGAFLSGGIDSSLVTALMQAQSTKPVRTFSIGFEQPEYNEAHYAKRIAQHLGTQHTEEYMTPQQAWDVIPKMASMYDEPFADSSQLPTYLLSMITKKHVTVALSGDGGDELFAGYTRYFNFMERFPAGHVPAWKKIAANSLAGLGSPETLDRFAKIIPPGMRPANFGARLHAFAKRSRMTSASVYRQIYLGHWPEPFGIACGAQEETSVFEEPSLESDFENMLERMQFLDSVNYLPDDILTKVDRASMACSLEARVPLIDHRVYEWSWRLPLSAKVREGKGKWILRKVLERYVPQNLFDRPKMGFGVPIDHWLRGPLRAWAEDLLQPDRMRQESFLNPEPIQAVWQKHLRREGDYHYWLWDVLMFQAWLRGFHENTEVDDRALLPDLSCYIEN